MGVTFAMALGAAKSARLIRWGGVVYGIAIWLCLLATLILTPHGQGWLFPLTPLTALLSLAGHLIYGGVLGDITARLVAVGGAVAAERATA